MASIEAVPAALDITCVAGDALRITLTASWADGSPIDWTDAAAQVRIDAADDTIQATFVCTADVTPGIVVMALSEADTEALAGLLPLLVSTGGRFQPLAPIPGFQEFGGVWDIQTGPSGSTRTIASGAFVVRLDVTRVP